MAKFLVVHPVGKAVKASSTVDAYWVRSWYTREEGKFFCEWDAKDAQSIHQVMTKAALDFPTEGAYKMEMMVTSEDFR